MACQTKVCQLKGYVERNLHSAKESDEMLHFPCFVIQAIDIVPHDVYFVYF